MAPVVSIIMPCYNAAAHLQSSVGSVLAQTFSDWELIAVDDGSTDNTLAWLQAQSDPRIRVHSQPNRGVSTARNVGLTEARATYVAFLDADDTWDTRFLEKMVASLQAHPQAVLVYCGWQNQGLEGGAGKPYVPPDYEATNKAESLFAGCGWPIIRVPEVLAFYHFHGGVQASSDRARAALQHWHAQQEYLASHPELGKVLGKSRIRELSTGEMLKRGYECYWKRDLPSARRIFRAVMKRGYGTLRDWKYMLPSWLPEAWHRKLILDSENNKTNPN
jgi:glycosyltransferase involved in cell wall biosynthesis